MVFRKEGLKTDFLKVNDELNKLSPETYEKFKYRKNQVEVIYENVAYVVISTPILGNLAHHIIRKMRSKN